MTDADSRRLSKQSRLLRQPASATADADSRRVPDLCSVCEGNGVVKIPGGVSVCDHCHGTCYEWQQSAPAPTGEAERLAAWLDKEADCEEVNYHQGSYQASEERFKKLREAATLLRQQAKALDKLPPE